MSERNGTSQTAAPDSIEILLNPRTWSEDLDIGARELGNAEFRSFVHNVALGRGANDAERRLEIELLIRNLQESITPAETFELLQVADFVDSVGEPPPAIIPGFMLPNTFGLLTGRPKQGKTFLAMQIADDIASGTPLFGKYPIDQPGPVVYLGMEDGKYGFRTRTMKRGMDLRNPPVFINCDTHVVSTAAGCAALAKAVEAISPRLIIIDTARQAFIVRDWNSSGEVQAATKPLADMVRVMPNGCSVLLLAHNNKNPQAEGGDKISGSNALQSNVDFYMILDRSKRLDNGDLCVELESVARNGDMPAHLDLVMDSETAVWRVAEQDEADARRDLEKKQQLEERAYNSVTKSLFAMPGQRGTLQEIATQAAMSEAAVRPLIRVAMEMGDVRTDGDVPGTRGKPVARYALVNSLTPEEPVLADDPFADDGDDDD